MLVWDVQLCVWLCESMLCAITSAVWSGLGVPTQGPCMTSSTAGAYIPVNPLSLAIHNLPRPVAFTSFFLATVLATAVGQVCGYW